MPQWKTRKRGSPAQIGKHFIVPEKGERKNLPQGLKVVYHSPKSRAAIEEKDIVEEAVEELREEESIREKLARELGDFKAEIEKRDRRARLKEALKELEKREQEGVYYQPEEEEEI